MAVMGTKMRKDSNGIAHRPITIDHYQIGKFGAMLLWKVEADYRAVGLLNPHQIYATSDQSIIYAKNIIICCFRSHPTTKT